MDIKYLTYFIQVCEDKNFSKAAHHLFITQQGLSNAIRTLEGTLGLPLFIRHPKGVELTSFGKALEPQARALIQQWQFFNQQAEQLKKGITNVLYLTVSLGTLNALSYEGILRFQKAFPKTQLVIKDVADHVASSALLANEAEATLTVGKIAHPEVTSFFIHSYQPMLIVPKNHRLANKPTIRYEDLSGETLFIINEQFNIYHEFLSRCHHVGVTPFIGLTTSDIRMIHTLVNEERGIGLTIDFVIQDFQHQNIIGIPFEDASFTWDVYFSTKQPERNEIATLKKYLLTSSRD